ncbi:synaptic vesicle glycoprotein 2B-like isoform X2 [Rhodnius prolixus]|uniref:synaptic vesicle glycoprotein 2B-like isoform X2 n=1 Tax=Rhodnius prolixus TaxID=13249 RepID=UPI003D187BD2
MKRSSTTPISRMSSRLRLSETGNQFLATPHAALSFSKVGGRTMYEATVSKITQSYLEQILFRKVVDGTEERINFNEALKESGFGRFQVLLIFTCGLVYFTCSASISSLSFVLPASKCDLRLSSEDMGIIYTSPLIGTFIWGPLSDTQGRRITLLVCLIIDLFATIVSSFSVNKWMLLSARWLNGMGIIGATSLVFAYLGEFLDDEKRDKILFLLELFYNFGVVYIPCISWLIIPLPVNIYLGGTFYYKSWNLFTLATGLPGLLAILLLLILPESPKFLLTRGEILKMSEILKKIYKINARKGKAPYSVKVLLDDPQIEVYFGMKPVHHQGYLKELMQQYKQLFGGTTVVKVIQLSLVNFFCIFSYMSLIIWIPELLHRRSLYLEQVPKRNTAIATLCYASQYMKSHHNVNSLHEKCVQTITTDIYLKTVFICASCIPATTLLFFALMYVPKTILVAVLMGTSGTATMALSFVHSDYLLLGFFCVFEASSTVIETIVFVIAVDLLPTNIIGIALATTVTCGRMAAVISNIFIGYLVDTYCNLTFYTLAASFYSGAVVAVTLSVSLMKQT